MGLTGALTRIFISPLPLILAISAGAILALAGRRRAGFWMSAAAVVVLTAASLEPVHDALLRPLEDSSPPLPAEAVPRLEAIVVLGGGTSAGSPELGGGAPGASSLRRIAYGYVLSRGNTAELIVSGGRVTRRDREPEAAVARRTLLSFGVPDDRITVEGGSRTTWENARLVAPLVAGAREVALVTSAFHMPRSLLAFSRAGVRCLPAPTDYLTQRAAYGPYSFLPSFQTLAESFVALREYAGLASYALRPR